MDLIYDVNGKTRAKAYPESGFISVKEGGFREIIFLPPGANMVICVDETYTYIERTETGRFIRRSCDIRESSAFCRYFTDLMERFCPGRYRTRNRE